MSICSRHRRIQTNGKVWQTAAVGGDDGYESGSDAHDGSLEVVGAARFVGGGRISLGDREGEK